MERVNTILQNDKIGAIAIASLAIVASLAFVLMGPMEFFLFTLGAIILTLVLIKPFYGLCFLVFSIPYAGILQIAPKLTANKIFAVWVLISFIVGLLVRKETIDILSSKSLKFYMIFHIWLLFMFPFGTINIDSLRAIFSRMFLFGLVFLIASIPKTYQDFKVICLISSAGAAFLGIYVATFGMGAMVGEYGTRLSAGTNENVLSCLGSGSTAFLLCTSECFLEDEGTYCSF